ncbi:MAG TPA: PEP-utilizing enzyme [Acidimicrobiales bacterium]|nr:PEP-utilizing enzyme [Acidimicrobiales bacterium]
MTDEVWDAPGPGPWMQDRAHLPASVTPIVQELYPEGFARGFESALAPYGVLLDRMQLAFVNRFPYTQPVSFDAPGPDGPKTPEQLGAEIGRRAALADEAFSKRIWRDSLKTWDEEAKPRSIARHRELAEVDLTKLDDEQLRAQLHARIEHMAAMWEQHHTYNGAALVAVGDFVLHAAGWTQRDPVPIFAVFDGWSPASGVLNPEIAPAIEALRADPDAAKLLTSEEPAEERLADLRARVPAVDAYIHAVGFRIAAGFDLTNPTVVERPDLVLGRLAAAFDYEADHSTERADALAADLRTATPAEHRAEFDDLLAEARLVYRLRDERGLYSDSSAVGLMRLALIELGSRLFDRGRIGFKYDTLDLRVAEIDAILDGSPDPTADALAARVAARKAASKRGAPPLLGPPPPPPPSVDGLPPPLARVMSALGFVISGVTGEAPAPAGDDRIVMGIGGSAGVYVGPARIVKNFDDLMELQGGEVLITSATGESFNSFLHVVGAIVTDHGSFASHAAIMGREMGFPAVVGTVDGTQRIPTGALVRVDGAAGTVEVVGFPEEDRP